MSVVDGYTFIDRISFDAYKEGEASAFERFVEMCLRRNGNYPEHILIDKKYQSRNNREFRKTHGILLSGLKPGHPEKNHVEEIRQQLQEIGERNVVKCNFGNGKRKLGLSLIIAKLKIITESIIEMDIFILYAGKIMSKKTKIWIVPTFQESGN